MRSPHARRRVCVFRPSSSARIIGAEKIIGRSATRALPKPLPALGAVLDKPEDHFDPARHVVAAGLPAVYTVPGVGAVHVKRRRQPGDAHLEDLAAYTAGVGTSHC